MYIYIYIYLQNTVVYKGYIACICKIFVQICGYVNS